MAAQIKVWIIIISLLIPSVIFGQDDNSTNKKMDKVIKLIENQYVDSVNMPELVEIAIKAILHDLDPHSKYMNKKELAENNESLKSSFGGVGLFYQILNDTLLVLSPTPNGPSENVGIKKGDKIIKINDKNVTGKNISNTFFTNLLRGENNSSVEITIKRHYSDSIMTFKVIRSQIPISTVEASFMLNETTAFLKISNFSFTTNDEIQRAFDRLSSQGMENIIIDLRGNPGGLMLAAIKLADEFLDANKLIVYTKGEHFKTQNYNSTSGGSMLSSKLIVLIDEGTASASEIFAGAMQDLDRGLIIGRKSYGKGLIGRNYNLPDGTAIRLITGHYYTPSGRCIQKSYENGVDEYKKDLKKRFENGEYLYADSTHFPDSLKFKTFKGRTVYGGGGIFPDIFFPMDTAKYPEDIKSLFAKGIIQEFAAQYFDANLEFLQINYSNIDLFEQNFIVKDEIINQIINFAKAKFNLNIDGKNVQVYKIRILKFYKAYLTRNLFGNSYFYNEIWTTDQLINYSLEIMHQGKIFKKYKISAN
ncbi:MAG: hypothetical protein AUJ98_07940 [Bacteroidetes bacterium CG2_30_33_31]|nr:MAG: hypothetical protein AUJ98_07940 [Bacteroidetes bacterium CG2_30_33_31]